jgi:hypothetical protein
MGASVISCVDAPPIFEAGEQVLDFMPLAIEIFVEIGGD